MEPTVIDEICRELDKANHELQLSAALMLGIVVAIVIGAGILFYWAPSEAGQLFRNEVVPVTSDVQKTNSKAAPAQSGGTAGEDASASTNTAVFALVMALTSKLFLIVAAFYLARIHLNVVRYNVRLANRYKAVKFILRINKASPDLSLRDLERIFDVDGYEFLSEKTINSDLASSLVRLVDKRISEVHDLTKRSTGPAQKAAQAG